MFRCFLYLHISFLAIGLAIPVSLLVFALLFLTGRAFSFVSAPSSDLPAVSVPFLLPLPVLLLLFLVTEQDKMYDISG